MSKLPLNRLVGVLSGTTKYSPAFIKDLLYLSFSMQTTDPNSRLHPSRGHANGRYQFSWQVAYAIGVAHPLSVNVEAFGTSKISDEKIAALVSEYFDLRRQSIARMPLIVILTATISSSPGNTLIKPLI